MISLKWKLFTFVFICISALCLCKITVNAYLLVLVSFDNSSKEQVIKQNETASFKVSGSISDKSEEIVCYFEIHEGDTSGNIIYSSKEFVSVYRQVYNSFSRNFSWNTADAKCGQYYAVVKTTPLFSSTILSFDETPIWVVGGNVITESEQINGNSKMYRMYNPNSGEHFYTSNPNEGFSLQKRGWYYEGIAWNSPSSGNSVYRLYNPNTGDHHYTTNAGEKDSLVVAGWSDEGIGWYSYPGSDGVPLYRLYNPNATGAGSHHYTTNASERDNLVAAGWQSEGVGWYGQP